MAEPLSEKTGRDILAELKAMRRNQEATMPMSVVEGIKRGRVEPVAGEPESVTPKVSRGKMDIGGKG